MKLQASVLTQRNAFTGYGEGYVTVNGARHAASLIVLADRIVPWPVAGIDALAAEHFAALVELRPEIVLLGTGARLRFPHPSLTAPLRSAGIGLEVMDTHAACRTYNILAAEERSVAAALVFG